MKKYEITFCYKDHWMEKKTIEADSRDDAVKELRKELGMIDIVTQNGQPDILNLKQEFSYINIIEK